MCSTFVALMIGQHFSIHMRWPCPSAGGRVGTERARTHRAHLEHDAENLLVAINNVAAAEAMVLGLKAGLPAQTVFDMVTAGAGNSRVFELRAPMMVKDRYDEPSMKVSVWQKDMAVIGAYARKIGVPTPMFDASVPVYDKAMRTGHAEEDTAAVCAVLEAMAGVKRRKKNGRAKRR
jgi:L-threonate 2-dehydrogenase